MDRYLDQFPVSAASTGIFRVTLSYKINDIKEKCVTLWEE
jgi:hypothetical protein